MGEYITKLALELRFSSSDDPGLSNIHPLAAEEQGRMYAERTRREDQKEKKQTTTLLSVDDAGPRQRRRSVFITEVDGLLAKVQKGQSNKSPPLPTKNELKAINTIVALREARAQRKTVDPKSITAHDFCGVPYVDMTPLPNNATPRIALEKIVACRMEENAEFKSKWKKELLNQPAHKEIIVRFFWTFFLDVNHVALIAEEKADNDAFEAQQAEALKEDPTILVETEDEKKERMEIQETRRLLRLESVQKHKDALFRALAESYLKVFMRAVYWRDRDDFFWIYPDLIAQSVYVLLCEAFTLSVEYFSTDFKIRLCDTIGEWFLGLKSYAMLWRKWDLDKILLTSVRLALNSKKGEEKAVVLEIKKKTASKFLHQCLSYLTTTCM